MEKDKVDKALEQAAVSLRRLEESGDIDGFVVIAQKKTSSTTDGITAICVANDRHLVTWAAALARAVVRRGHHSPRKVAQDLYDVITRWSRYEKEYAREDWEGEKDDRKDGRVD